MLHFSGREAGGALYRNIRLGKLSQLCSPGVYTDDFETPVEDQVKQNLFSIMHHYGVKGNIAYRSSLEFPKFSDNDEIIISGQRKRDLILPGTIIHVYGSTEKEQSTVFCSEVPDNEGYTFGLFVPAIELAVLQNLSSSRPEQKKSNPELAKEKLSELYRQHPSSVYDRMQTVAEATGRTDSLPAVQEYLFEIGEKDREDQRNRVGVKMTNKPSFASKPKMG
jgi:hypothetical protein